MIADGKSRTHGTPGRFVITSFFQPILGWIQSLQRGLVN